MMEFVNEATAAKVVPRAWFEAFVKLLSPFAPHLAEEMWQRLGYTKTITYEPWPTFDPQKLVSDVKTLGVQVNGKRRGEITVATDATDAEIFAAAKADAKVAPYLDGKPIKREIYKGNVVSLVV